MACDAPGPGRGDARDAEGWQRADNQLVEPHCRAGGGLASHPLKKLPWPAESTGVGWMVQVVPFHRSARVVVPEFDVAFRFPAAVQVAGVVQDTAARTPPGGGFEDGSVLQFVPSTARRACLLGCPRCGSGATAVQNEGEVQDTPAKKLPGAPRVRGRAGSAIACRPSAPPQAGGEAELSKDVPTAMQNVWAVQETPNRALPGARWD